jgi:hypothetical protein
VFEGLLATFGGFAKVAVKRWLMCACQPFAQNRLLQAGLCSTTFCSKMKKEQDFDYTRSFYLT